MTIDFRDKVAIVTGAGNGIGRAYAIELARRGAKVVVNDLGGERDGTGHSDASLQVVAEITAAGGEAMADGSDVSQYDQMEAMVARTCQRWGGVQVLINNAGILRDRTFLKMTPAEFEMVVRVHLLGTAYATHAVWPVMRDQGYGRVLMTSSSSGLGGNFGQANYAAAKAGIIGLAKTLSLEGAKYDIRVNLIAPTAGTRMTEDIFPEDAFNAFTPESVAAAGIFLVGKDAPANVMMGAGGGVYQSFWLTMNEGVLLTPEEQTAEGVAAAWDRISDRTSDAPLKYGMEQSTHALDMLTNAKKD